MKKIISSLLALVLCFIMSFNVLAATTGESIQAGDAKQLQQQIKEVNAYLQQHSKPIDVKEQSIKYNIPLSDGTTAKYSLTLTQIAQNRTIMDAKVGVWNFDSDLSLPLHGSIKVRTTVNIREVPTSPGGFIRFSAYNGSVTAIPSQYCTVDSTSATTNVVYTDIWYDTTGYVGFLLNGVPANLYFTQTISFVDNQENYNKIECTLNYDM